MFTTPTFPDVELWLCGEIRGKVAAPAGYTLHVDAVEPKPRPSGFLVLVHYDGGVQDSVVTETCTVRIRTIGPDADATGKLTGDLARAIRRVVADAARVEPGNPVAAVPASRGPYRVTHLDGDRPEFYQNVDLVIVGD